MTRQNRRWCVFAGVHAAGLALAALTKAVLSALPAVPVWLRSCPLPRLLHLYCPGCGGTRAAAALLSGRLADAFRYHPMVPLVAGWLLILDAVVAVRIARGRERPLAFPAAVWALPLAAFLLFAVGRDVALAAWGFDPIGDLAVYWN